jgi:serine/threonine-protein kinase
MVPSNDVVTALDEKNGFIYSEFTNSKGQTSKGWLRRQDLITLEEWVKNEKEAKPEPKLTNEDIALQLGDAKRLLEEGRTNEAINIYSYLSDQNVPEAMYHYGNLGLQKKSVDLDCERSYELVKKASDKGFAPAKRTLGFLYLFADSEEVLRINEYEGCNYDRNVFKGSKLLMEAMMAGDSTAKRLLNEIKAKQPTDSTSQ